MTQYVFGTGQVFATDTDGSAPLRVGALQDVSVDISGDIKELYGQYQFALDVARGKTKIEWKAASGNIDVVAYNRLFFDQTVETGSELVQAFNESASVPASVAYTITAANAAGFFQDLGVFDALTGNPMVQVTAAPAAGQYSVNAGTGVYTFAAADANKAVLLNYLWEANTGATLNVNNQLMGAIPKYRLVLSQLYDGKSFTMVLFKTVSDKLSLPFKQDDYMIGELSGMAQADDAGRIMRISTTSATGGGG